jgi:hypothetical protein
MKQKKWKLTIFTIIILIFVASGFFISGWNDPLLWGGWFASLGSAIAVFTGGNYFDKREHIRNGNTIDESIKK